MPAVPNNQELPVPDEVAAVFDTYEEPVRTELLALRKLILSTAQETEGAGPITETLKWGQPAYLTAETGSGSTIRIAPTGPGSDHDYAMFFICHTDLIDGFKGYFGDAFTYDGNRALLFSAGDEHPESELRGCITMALTYHLTDA